MKRKTMKSAVLKVLKLKRETGMSKSELSRELSIDPGQRKELRALVTQMTEEGELRIGKKGRYFIASPGAKADTLQGVYRQNPKGFGWFYPEAASIEASGLPLSLNARVKIGDRDRLTAIDGDKVEVKMKESQVPLWKKKRDADRRAKGKPAAKKENRFSDDLLGRITKIVARREGPIIGTYFDRGRFKNVQPDDLTIPQLDITEAGEAQSGQKVVVELVSWDDPRQRPVGKVLEVIGWPDSPGVDILSVIKRHNLSEEFPEEVVAEAESCPKTLSDEELKRRKDHRNQMIVTVDPADARDHDDACYVEALPDGGWRLAVHIADVSYYVTPGSALDIEAKKRGNSTYLVDRVLPMLPPVLSNGLCSITPEDDTATKCCTMIFTADGVMKKARFTDAVMRSRARLSYEQAQEMMNGEGGGEIGDMLRESWKLASTLRARRFNHGALDMEFPEVRVMCDDQGEPQDIVLSEHTTSHQMIEEFMLAANEASAKALKDRGKPTIYRIHEDPDPDRLIDYSELARAHGYQPGDLTNRKHIQHLLDAARGKPEEYAIKLGLLKSLKRAAYAIDPIGHYGLAKENYCHFTSPIRRYADLIVHRSLQAVLENPPQNLSRTPKQVEAADIAKHISTTERNSSEAEIATKRMKQMEYLWKRLEAGDPPVYPAVVTDVRRMGLFIECPTILQRGVVKREDLPRGNWQFDPNRMEISAGGGRKYSLGQQITVQVCRVNTVDQHVDFRVIAED